ncbi:MAG TPA: wax ester/triacylglycerol synthase family O-acyltransferase [Candidatus Dormibacteraeota bacterium]
MSPLDASFIHIEDANNPMHIGSVVVFEGPPPAYGDLVRLVAGKLPLVPRYRQKVREVPFQLGRPVWVDDPHFTILYHIRRTGVPAPGGEEELRNLAGRVLAQHLDRARPLWELWMVEGLRQDRWALIAKTHHAMVDGVSGTDLLAVLLDASPDGASPVEMEWRAEPEPNALQLLADTAVSSVMDPLTHVRGLPAVARTPLATISFAQEILAGTVSQALRLARPAAPGLNGPIGPHRRWSWARGSLAEIKEIREAFGGTVNDVVLAVITRGFRDLLRGRQMALQGRMVRTLVPVSVRAPHERGTYNNRVSGIFADLPVEEADPVARLHRVSEQMEGLKSTSQAVAGDVLARMSGFAPPMLLALGARLGTIWPQRSVNTVTTNVPGPQVPLYAVGRRMLEAYPYVPIGGNIRIAIAIFSYCGVLNFGVTGDYDTVRDLDVLVAGIEAGQQELRERARKERPKSRRRPARRPSAARASAARAARPRRLRKS